MDSVALGSSALEASQVGLGCWALGGHGWGEVTWEEALATVRRAHELGVTMFDTADCYGLGRSETLLAEALGADRHQATIATKIGVRWDESRQTWHDCNPGYLRRALEASLQRLRLEAIPLCYIHWPDDQTPVSAAVEVLAREMEKGKVLGIGLSNHSCAQVLEALDVAHICAIQLRCSMINTAEARRFVGLAAECQLALVAWGALGQGLLTGKLSSTSAFGKDDHRSRAPEFLGERFSRGLEVSEAIRDYSRGRGVAPAQVPLRWVLDYPGISVALAGARRPEQIEDTVGAVAWSMPRSDWQRLEELGAAAS